MKIPDIASLIRATLAKSAFLTAGRSLPVYPQLRTYRCTAL